MYSLMLLLAINQWLYSSELVFYVSFSLLVITFSRFLFMIQSARLSTSTPSSSPTPTKNFDEDNQLIHKVVLELQKFLSQEITIIENELIRTNKLVEEAEISLSTSFKQLHYLIEHQQLSLTTVNADALNINSLSEQVKKMEVIVLQGVYALQFEDLTKQSLSSLQQNINSIQTIITVLGEFEQVGNNLVHQQLLDLKYKCQEVYQQTKVLEENRSVKQLTMEEGEVELF